MREYLNLRPNIALGIIGAFLLNTLGPLPVSRADEFALPAPGQMVALSPAYDPAVLKGIKLDAHDPLKFHFYVDAGSRKGLPSRGEASKLIKYFLASLAIPEKDLWVNLSPYEKDRVVPKEFGLTEMGRDLLAQDYLLKQITASLIYPESRLGKEFWQKVYTQAQAQYGTTNIPVNTFNKVWIVPEKAVVYENAGTAFVLENHLKVMLEEDYLSLQKHTVILSEAKDLKASKDSSAVPQNDGHSLASNIIRQIVIPALTREVNEGRNFAQLRQVFYSLILATWYKKKIRDSILNKVYSDQKRIRGVGYDNIDIEAIYQRYITAFKKGVYSYIKEEPDQITGRSVPKKYFSGGVNAQLIGVKLNTVKKGQVNAAQLAALAEEPMVDIAGDVTVDRSDLNYKKAAIVPWQEVVSDPRQSLNDEAPAVLEKFGPRENRASYWANNQDVREGFLKLVQEIDSGLFEEGPRHRIIDQLAVLHRSLLMGARGDSLYHSRMFYLHPSATRLEDLNRVRKDAGAVIQKDSERVTQRSRRIFAAFIAVLDEIHNRDSHRLEQFIDKLADFYIEMIKGQDAKENFLFVYGNDSFSLNMVNGFIRLNGLNGISHGRLEAAARWLPKENLVKDITALLLQTNPGLDLSDLNKAMSAHAEPASNFLPAQLLTEGRAVYHSPKGDLLFILREGRQGSFWINVINISDPHYENVGYRHFSLNKKGLYVRSSTPILMLEEPLTTDSQAHLSETLSLYPIDPKQLELTKGSFGMWVEEEYRQLGVGINLVRYYLAVAKASGARVAYLNATTDKLYGESPTMDFYKNKFNARPLNAVEQNLLEGESNLAIDLSDKAMTGEAGFEKLLTWMYFSSDPILRLDGEYYKIRRHDIVKSYFMAEKLEVDPLTGVISKTDRLSKEELFALSLLKTGTAVGHAMEDKFHTGDAAMITRVKPVVFIVDDQMEYRNTLRDWVKELEDEYKILFYASAQTALEYLDAYKPRLVITDTVMPGMTGPDFVKALNKRDPKLRVIAISAEKSNLQEYRDSPVEFHVKRELSKSKFIKLIEKYTAGTGQAAKAKANKAMKSDEVKKNIRSGSERAQPMTIDEYDRLQIASEYRTNATAVYGNLRKYGIKIGDVYDHVLELEENELADLKKNMGIFTDEDFYRNRYDYDARAAGLVRKRFREEFSRRLLDRGISGPVIRKDVEDVSRMLYHLAFNEHNLSLRKGKVVQVRYLPYSKKNLLPWAEISGVLTDFNFDKKKAVVSLTLDKNKPLRISLLTDNIAMNTYPEIHDLVRIVPAVNRAMNSVQIAPYGIEQYVRRSFGTLNDMYGISKDFDAVAKQPVNVLLIGVGRGIAAVEMALRYPNFHIVGINREGQLWDEGIITGEMLKKGYLPGDIKRAFNRITIKIVDMDNGQDVNRRLAGWKFNFIIFEGFTAMYFKDKARVFEKMFNEKLMVGGVLAIVIQYMKKGINNSESLLLEDDIARTIQRSFLTSAQLLKKTQNNEFDLNLKYRKLSPKFMHIPLILRNAKPVRGFAVSKPAFLSFYDEDRAMNVPKREGGINLNPAQMSLQVRNEGEDFKFDLNGADSDTGQVMGATFNILQMTPVVDLLQTLDLK
jgi:CheY-like chemotaxis protein